ncbi:MAG: thermonuclease family protein [Nitrospirae bacterium]|nr:thermonuclease family protein [Nitrospirota bacterium]
MMQLLLILLLLLSPSPALASNRCEYREVSRVIDGDTIVLKNGQRVRLLGIDTPESADPRRPVQFFGLEAKQFLKRLVEHRTVCLRRDRDRTINKDKYNRLLRYIYLDKLFVNKEIVKKGYGFVFVQFPFQYMEEFRKLQQEAMEKEVGLWNDRRYRTWIGDYAKSLSRISNCISDAVVCSWNAIKYIGKKKKVRFLIKKVHNAGERIYFNSEDDIYNPRNFTVVLPVSNRDYKDIEMQYWGRIAEVRGYIRENHGRAEMEIRDLKELVILNSDGS